MLTENFKVLSLELASIFDVLKVKTRYPHQVLFGIIYSNGTLTFDDLGTLNNFQVFSGFSINDRFKNFDSLLKNHTLKIEA